MESEYFSLCLNTVEFLWFADYLADIISIAVKKSVVFRYHFFTCMLMHSFVIYRVVQNHLTLEVTCVQRSVKWFALLIMQSDKSMETCAFSYITNCIHLLSCYFCSHYFSVKLTLIVSQSMI